jgi:small GTP-binding protein
LISVKIWDTAGQERFRTITYSFYKQANGVLVTFDVTNRQTFSNVKNWLESIYQHADPSIGKVLVGNKIDLVNER